MRVKLKGLHTVVVPLASGCKVTYVYAWRGGPRLHADVGTPEFMAEYNAAHQGRRESHPEQLRSIVSSYKASRDFSRLAPRTQADYLQQIAKIEAKFGTLPIAALDAPRITHKFLEWRDKLPGSPKQADYAWTVLMLILSWARTRGLTTYRPPDRVEKLYHADRSEKVWSAEDIASFMAVAGETMRRAMMLAAETGQRQGDLLVLPKSADDGTHIRLRQSKTGARVAIKVTARLREALRTAPATASTTILTSTTGRPWKPNAFRNRWRDTCRAAGIVGLTFHDLRGTAVTRLAEAGCTHQEIASVTGHSLRDVGAILDKYLARTSKLADAGIDKLERSRS